jgi:hypothetical protein
LIDHPKTRSDPGSKLTVARPLLSTALLVAAGLLGAALRSLLTPGRSRWIEICPGAA